MNESRSISGASDIPAVLNPARQSGLTLVELLVAMLIGLFLVAGVVSVMVDSKNSFLTEQELSYIQENARFLQDELGYDIRMAGFAGCNANATVGNAIDAPATDDNWMFASPGIMGFEAVDDDSDAPDFGADVSTDTDVVVISRAEPLGDVRTTGYNASSANIDTIGDTDLPEAGTILMMASSNCRHMGIFQVTGYSGNEQKINHNTGTGYPGNCSKAMSKTDTGGGFDCTSPPPSNLTGFTFPPGSPILEYVSHAYFIADSDITGLPTLYRESLSVSDGNATTNAQELVSGVEDMQILYGVDSTATSPDGVVDQYFKADDIAERVAIAPGWVGWDRVLSVRLDLVLRSSRPVFTGNKVVDLGGGFTFNDRYMRQRVSSTIRIRNRAGG